MMETTENTDEKIHFFGEVDLNAKGGRVSDVPAWCFDVHIDEMEENIRRKERQIELGIVAKESVHTMREEISGERERLASIKNSKPDLKGPQKDKCYNSWKSLGERIRDTMPTRKELHDGLVSAHDELKRMKDKHISVSPEIAKACMVKPVKGKISGDEANKCYRILGAALGESVSTERLRRDGGGEAYKTMNDLTQAILQGRTIKGA
jgi:hypothetical protein